MAEVKRQQNSLSAAARKKLAKKEVSVHGLNSPTPILAPRPAILFFSLSLPLLFLLSSTMNRVLYRLLYVSLAVERGCCQEGEDRKGETDG